MKKSKLKFAVEITCVDSHDEKYGQNIRIGSLFKRSKLNSVTIV